jgi:hypothetical protein
MPELSFNVYCGTCGAALCTNTTVRSSRVMVDACQSCLDREYRKGHDEGYNDGYRDATEHAAKGL